MAPPRKVLGVGRRIDLAAAEIGLAALVAALAIVVWTSILAPTADWAGRRGCASILPPSKLALRLCVAGIARRSCSCCTLFGAIAASKPPKRECCRIDLARAVKAAGTAGIEAGMAAAGSPLSTFDAAASRRTGAMSTWRSALIWPPAWLPVWAMV